MDYLDLSAKWLSVTQSQQKQICLKIIILWDIIPRIVGKISWRFGWMNALSRQGQEVNQACRLLCLIIDLHSHETSADFTIYS